jgi:hypothetical protein
LSLFMMGPRGLAKWTADADVLVDDRPFLEYIAARQIGDDPFAAILASMLPDLEDPAVYLPPGTVATPDAVRARTAAITRALCPPDHLDDCTTSVERELGEPTRSERLHHEYAQLIIALANRQADPAAREAVFRRGIAKDADLGEAMVNLAVMLAQRGAFDEAEVLAKRAAEIPRTREGAERLLAQLHASGINKPR